MLLAGSPLSSAMSIVSLVSLGRASGVGVTSSLEIGLGEEEVEASCDSLGFLDLTETETDVPSFVRNEVDFFREAFARRSVTVAEGAGLSFLDLSFLVSLELGDLGDLTVLRELDLPPLEGMSRRRRLAVVELGEDCRQLD